MTNRISGRLLTGLVLAICAGCQNGRCNRPLDSEQEHALITFFDHAVHYTEHPRQTRPGFTCTLHAEEGQQFLHLLQAGTWQPRQHRLYKQHPDASAGGVLDGGHDRLLIEPILIITWPAIDRECQVDHAALEKLLTAIADRQAAPESSPQPPPTNATKAGSLR